MLDLNLGGQSPAAIPRNRRLYTTALLVHLVIVGALVYSQRSRLVRLAGEAAMRTGIAAYIPGPVGTAGSSVATPATTAAPKKKAPTQASRQPAKDDGAGSDRNEQAVGSQGSGGGGGSGPVRFGTGGSLTLLTKVKPTYPRMLESARIPGTVVLDAVIHQDGSIGDVKVLSATHPLFAQAAVEAVKRWRYAPVPFEGIVTVTVNFTL